MGGNIYLKSQVGVGSEFYFSINYEVANDKEILKENKLKDIVGIKNQNFSKTILVVDDILENRELITQLLNSCGFNTLEASSGVEALNIFNQNRIDLIFMDILMEGMDGLETISNIRRVQKNLDIPIIALSANVFEEDKKEAINSGANDFISKPIEEKVIYQILQKYLSIEFEYQKKDEKNIDVDSELKELPEDFFKKLNEKTLLMDNENILNHLKEFSLSDSLKAYLEAFVSEFKYKELMQLCKKYSKK